MGRTNSKDNSTFGNDTIFNVTFKPKSPMEVWAKGYPDSIFSSEQAQVDILKDIYPIIKDEISLFAESKSFSNTTPVYEVLQWCMDRYTDAIQSDSWSIIKHKDKYAIEIFETYKQDFSGYSFPVDGIFGMKEGVVKTFFLNVLLLLKHLKISIWDEQEMMLEFTAERIDECESEEEIKDFKYWLECYETGDAYKAALWFKQHDFNQEIFLESYRLVKAKKKLPKELLSMIDKIVPLALEMLKSGFKIGNFIYVDQKEYKDEYPATPEDYIMMQWNCDDYNPVWKDMEFYYEDKCNNFGYETFYHHMLITEPKTDTTQPLFPYQLLELMMIMCELTFRKTELLK